MKDIDTDAMGRALQNIISHCGSDILKDDHKFQSAIRDFLAGFAFETEQKLLILSVREGVGKNFLSAINSPVAEQNRVLNLARHTLVKDLGLVESRCESILDAYCFALGWQNKKTTNETTTNKKTPKTQSPKNSKQKQNKINTTPPQNVTHAPSLSSEQKGKTRTKIICIAILLLGCIAFGVPLLQKTRIGPRFDLVAFSPDGKYFATAIGSKNQTPCIWDPGTGKIIRSFEGHKNGVHSVAFSPDGKYLATGSDDKTAKIWNLITGNEIQTFEGHKSTVNSVVFSPDGKYLATGSDDETAKIWNIDTGEEIWSFKMKKVHLKSLTEHLATHSVDTVAFSPDGKYLAAGSDDATAKIWDTSTGKEIWSFKAGEVHLNSFDPELVGSTTHSVDTVAFSPDGKYLVTGIEPYERIWDIATGKEIHFFEGHKYPLLSIAFSFDMKYFAAVRPVEGTARIWDLGTGKIIRSFEGHKNWVKSVAFSPDGKYLATCSIGEPAKIWNITTGKEIRTFEYSHFSFESVAFSPDGKYLVTGTALHERIWDIAKGKEIDFLK